MKRGYPRFLYSDPKNAATPGPFIVHTLHPQFICRIVDDVEELRGKDVYYIHVSGWTLELLEIFVDLKDDNSEKIKVSDIMYRMLTWVAKQNFK
jgi:hypothetical protein